MDTKIDGTPFSVLMDQAIKLKNAQAAPLRSKFDSYPSFYQNSIFPSPEVVEARKAEDFDGRMSSALAFKEAGNVSFRNGDFAEAVLQYEMGLSVFRYLENTNEAWRTEGIKDDFIKQVSYRSENQEENRQVDAFLVSCCGNIALCCLKTSQFRIAINACNEALKIDRGCVKALYLRSQARIAPKSAGALEHDMALKDLEDASKIDPTNHAVRIALARLRDVARAQKQLDKKTFRGMFERGSICTDTRPGHDETKASGTKTGHTIAEASSLADSFAMWGMAKEEQELRAHIEQAKAKAKAQELMDFRQPTQQMIDEAEKRGIDLSDERVVNMLEQLQKERDATTCETRERKDFRGALTYVWKQFQQLPLQILYFLVTFMRS